MRGLRSTALLLAVLIGLGAYIYFVTWKQTSEPAGAKLEKLFATLEPDKIDEITIKAESGDVTTLKKTADGWQITAPLSAPASANEISAITSALGQLEIVRVIDENPASPDEFGLNAPRVEVTFKSADAKSSGRLLLGQKTAAGGNVYAARNDEKRVLLIADYQEGTVNKSTFDLRDKAILRFKRDQVDGIEVNANGKTIQLGKSGTEWKLQQPVAVRADFSAAEALAGRIEAAQMKSIVTSDPTAADLKKYGFDKPAVTVTLHLGSARATLAIGGKASEDAVYARDASKPLIVTVEKTLADDLAKSADDYRRKDIFEFRAYNANRIELTKGAQTITFERVKSKDEGKPDNWRRITPNPADVDREKMEKLLTDLADFRAASFTASRANTGLDAPVLTVAVKFDEANKEERVSFGKADSDEFAATADPGAVKLEAARLDDVIKTLDELSK